MRSSFPPPWVIPLRVSDDDEQGAGTGDPPNIDDLINAFADRLFSDTPPDWAAEAMEELRRPLPR